MSPPAHTPSSWVERLLGRAVRLLLFVLGIDIPRNVPIGPGLTLVHATAGLVVHPDVRIGRDVTILHGVTLGAPGETWVGNPARPVSAVERAAG